jgi:hypothetical protein
MSVDQNKPCSKDSEAVALGCVETVCAPMVWKEFRTPREIAAKVTKVIANGDQASWMEKSNLRVFHHLPPEQ